jgi:hypothetical protein
MEDNISKRRHYGKILAGGFVLNAAYTLLGLGIGELFGNAEAGAYYGLGAGVIISGVILTAGVNRMERRKCESAARAEVESQNRPLQIFRKSKPNDSDNFENN